MNDDSVADRLIGRSAKVRVPATSANLGPGYDSSGLALSMFDELEATILDGDELRINISGEGADTLPRDDNHLVVRSIARGLAELGIQLRGLELTCTNSIPHGKGLGSSSAAIVGGLALARALSSDLERSLSESDVLELATAIEGHPDNVAPAILGGFVIAYRSSIASTKSGVSVFSHDVHSAIEPVVAIPSEALATERARELLPSSVPHEDAAMNSAAAALLSLAVTSDPNLLMAGTEDRIHQQYRRFAYPDSFSLVTSLRNKGIPAAISGAGPTVIAFGVKGTQWDGDAVAAELFVQVDHIRQQGLQAFEVVAVDVSNEGAIAI